MLEDLGDANIDNLLNSVWGETEADRIRHTQARVIFMNFLVEYMDKQGIFKAWAIAARLTVRASGTATAYPLADRYVHEELGLPWEWVTVDLVSAWLAILLGLATDAPQKLIRQYIPYEPPAPTVQYQFETRPDETFAAMLDRFKEETSHFLKEQTERYKTLHPQGRLLSNQDVERYVEWFFRLHVLKESPRHIGMYDGNGKKLKTTHVRDRNDVKAQSEIARKWLSFGFTQQNFEETLLKKGNEKSPPGEDDPEANSPTSAAP